MPLRALLLAALSCGAASAAPRPELVLQTGHSLPVAAAALSPDGRLAATAGRDGYAALWDARAGWKLRSWQADPLGATAVAFSQDSRRLLVGGAGVVTLWEAATGRLVKRFGDPGEFVHWTSFSKDGRLVLAGGDDDTIKAWDARTGRLMQLYRTEGSRRLSSVALSSDGTELAAADGSDTLWVWSVATAEVKALKGGSNWRCLAFLPDGRHLATGGEEWAAVWDVARGVETMRVRTPALRAVAASPDGRLLATAGTSTARLWTADAGRAAGVLIGHADAINAIVFSAAGGRVLTASDDRTAALWDAASGRLLARLGRQPAAPLFAALVRPGLLSVDSGQATVWDLDKGRPLRARRFDWAGASGFSASADGRYVAAVNANGTLALLDFQGRAPARDWSADHVRAVSLDGGGRRLFAAGDGGVQAWELPSGHPSELALPPLQATQLLASQDGARLVSVDASGEIAAWDLSSGRRLAAFRAGDSLEPRLAIAPDGRAAAAAGAASDGRGHARFVLTARSLDDGRELARWEGPTELSPMAFDEDGARLWTEADSRLSAWELDSRRRLAALPAGADSFEWPQAVDARRGLAVARDGQGLAVVSLKTGRALARLLVVEGGWLVEAADGRLDGAGDAARWTIGLRSLPLRRSSRRAAGLLASLLSAPGR